MNWRHKFWGGQWYRSVVWNSFVSQWIRRALNVSLYEFSSWIGMWNRLFTHPIDDREVMDGWGEGTSAKEENVGREWFSATDMTVGKGVAVGLWLCFIACAIKNKEWFGIQGVSARTFSTRLYGNVTIHKIIKFYECFGRVTIVKTIHYLIL